MSPEDDSGGAERAARLATLPRALAAGGPRLIGTMGAPGLRRALVREAGGTIRTVARGDTVQGGRIVEVEAAALRLHTGDRIARLDLDGTGSGVAASPRPRPRPQGEPRTARETRSGAATRGAASGARPRRRPATAPG